MGNPTNISRVAIDDKGNISSSVASAASIEVADTIVAMKYF